MSETNVRTVLCWKCRGSKRNQCVTPSKLKAGVTRTVILSKSCDVCGGTGRLVVKE